MFDVGIEPRQAIKPASPVHWQSDRIRTDRRLVGFGFNHCANEIGQILSIVASCVPFLDAVDLVQIGVEATRAAYHP